VVIVIASITVRQGKRDEFISAFKDNLPAVHAEDGCIEYVPTVDLVTDVPVQDVNEHCVTIVEKWQSLSALQAHMKAPHMAAYRERVKNIVAGTSLKILEAA